MPTPAPKNDLKIYVPPSSSSRQAIVCMGEVLPENRKGGNFNLDFLQVGAVGDKLMLIL